VGSAGAAGISEVKVIAIPDFLVSTNTRRGAASSAPFGSLATNSSYIFQIYLSGEGNLSSLDFAATLSSSGETPVYNYASSRSTFTTKIDKDLVYAVTITGTIKTLGASSTLTVNIIDVSGESGGAAGVTFSGRAYLQKVGTIN
jgi:hypothetical protein